ncbi:MAG: hypothetical protein MUF10_04845 [Thermoanaerobaculaceae bacterium]|nr:hypothetical protein [Thermoanaerobaculaceae bacterium]
MAVPALEQQDAEQGGEHAGDRSGGERGGVVLGSPGHQHEPHQPEGEHACGEASSEHAQDRGAEVGRRRHLLVLEERPQVSQEAGHCREDEADEQTGEVDEGPGHIQL